MGIWQHIINSTATSGGRAAKTKRPKGQADWLQRIFRWFFLCGLFAEDTAWRWMEAFKIPPKGR